MRLWQLCFTNLRANPMRTCLSLVGVPPGSAIAYLAFDRLQREYLAAVVRSFREVVDLYH